MNIVRKLTYFFERKIQPGFTIAKNELVIDIGSGDKPFWRADVFLDDLDMGNDQRISGTKTINSLGYFVNGNILKTKFKKKAFDFSYCSHLLEHVTDPDKAIKEIERISKRGYIEVPNGLNELIKPFHSHLWLIFHQNGQLIFIRKSNVLHDVLTENSKEYGDLMNRSNNPFITFFWEKHIPHIIIKNEDLARSFIAKNHNQTGNQMKESYYIIAVKFLRTLFYKKKDSHKIKKQIF